MSILQTENLTHQFAGTTVLNNLGLTVPARSIYGFLGPNGAGKTTTLKLLLGLLKKQQGRVSVFGQDLEKNRVMILKKTGSLIESPSFYGHLTAVENLALLQKVYRCPAKRIGEVLSLVGLPASGKKKVSQFSLGMKQRLGVAMALLNDPPLLILDEPTNGLDPAGIVDMRNLFLQLNQERGTTILVSSHLLAEIEKLVTHVGVVHKGNLLFDGTIGQLKQKQQARACMSLDTGDTERTLRLLQQQGLSPTVQEEKVLVNFSSKEAVADVIAHLVKNKVHVYEVRTVNDDLETIFMNMING